MSSTSGSASFSKGKPSRRWLSFAMGLVLAVFTTAGSAKVYYSKQEAMELAFGPGATVEMRPLFLTDAQRRAIERLARAKLESNLYTFYVGKRDGRIVGYAAIETHTVRTKPETLMIVLTPDGQVRDVVVLAFHEPPEYQPPEPWFRQLAGKPVTALRVGGEVDGVSGATLSVRGTLESVRKVLSLYAIGIGQGPSVAAVPGGE